MGVFSIVPWTAVVGPMALLLLAAPLFLFAGGLVDSISDLLGLSTVTTASALVLPALLLPLPRQLGRHHRPSAG